MPRDRHQRRPKRPVAYALLLALAFATAAVCVQALWRGEHTAMSTAR